MVDCDSLHPDFKASLLFCDCVVKNRTKPSLFVQLLSTELDVLQFSQQCRASCYYYLFFPTRLCAIVIQKAAGCKLIEMDKRMQSTLSKKKLDVFSINTGSFQQNILMAASEIHTVKQQKSRKQKRQ